MTMPTEAKCCEGVVPMFAQLEGIREFLKELPVSAIQMLRTIADVTIGDMLSMDLTTPRFCAKLSPKGDGCEDGWSCDSVEGAQAQLGKYWMPCGALTLEPDSDENKRHLCRPENIIT